VRVLAALLKAVRLGCGWLQRDSKGALEFEAGHRGVKRRIIQKGFNPVSPLQEVNA